MNVFCYLYPYDCDFLFLFSASDKPDKGRLYKPTSKLAELASTFKSVKDAKKDEDYGAKQERLVRNNPPKIPNPVHPYPLTLLNTSGLEATNMYSLLGIWHSILIQSKNEILRHSFQKIWVS